MRAFVSLLIILAGAIGFGIVTPASTSRAQAASIEEVRSDVQKLNDWKDKELRSWQTMMVARQDSGFRLLQALTAMGCIDLEIQAAAVTLLPCSEVYTALKIGPATRRRIRERP